MSTPAISDRHVREPHAQIGIAASKSPKIDVRSSTLRHSPSPPRWRFAAVFRSLPRGRTCMFLAEPRQIGTTCPPNQPPRVASETALSID